MLPRTRIFLLLCCLVPGSILAVESLWQGKPIGEFIAHLSMQGLKIIYSSDVVLQSYLVKEEPNSEVSPESLQQVLRPYGLIAARGPGNSWLVIENPDARAARAEVVTEAPQQPALTEIVVSSSVYRVRYQKAGSHVFLDRDFIAGLPDVGEETLSSLTRLPGVASGGVSARSHVRGGAANEQLILFDGLRLYEPYHLKDFHKVATTVDPSTVDGMDFYTAGYQARFGDRMSGVVDIGLRAPADTRETELGLSFFNAWAFSSGRFGTEQKGDWTLSARRSNLDLISRAVNPDLGTPRFSDYLVHVGWQWSDRNYLTTNFLYSFDNISLAQEDQSEQATARYRNRVAWLKLETDWSRNVSSSTILSATDIKNLRNGQSDLPDVLEGTVDDRRDFTAYALTQDWNVELNDVWMFRAGVDVKFLDAVYVYDSTLQIFSPFDQILDNVSLLQRSFDLAPSGEQFAAYVEARWQATDRLILDLGLRWDRQTYSASDNNEQRSPRFNALYTLGDRTELRFGIGRFYQAQEINELQVSDGLTNFLSPQYADHVVVSLVRHLTPNLSFRAEYYQKDYDQPAPRFENAFDSLVIIPELQIDRARIDASNSFVRGVELTLTGTDEGLSWWAGLVWSLAEDKVGGRDERRSWDQLYSVTAGTSGRWRGWDISVAGAWHSGWPETRLIIESVDLPNGSTELLAMTTARNRSEYADFHSLDVRASRTFQLADSELEAFLEVSNISDRQNPCCTRYSMRSDGNGGRVIDADQSNWLPLIPSLGIIWRF